MSDGRRDDAHALRLRPWMALVVLALAVAAGAATTLLAKGTSHTGAATQRWPTALVFHHDSRQVSACGARDDACLRQAYGNVAFEQGAPAALGLLRTRIEHDSRLAMSCHLIAHTVAAAVVARDPAHVERQLAYGSQFCDGGYEHGLLTAALRGLSPAAAQARLERMCAATAQGYPRFQCAHGSGHGLRIYYGTLQAALGTCGRMNDVNPDDCADGAFMQDGTLHAERAHIADGAEALRLCAQVPTTFALACYRRIPQRMQEEAATQQQIARTCGQVPLAGGRTGCFSRYGSLAVEAFAKDAREAQRECSLAGPDYNTCLIHSVGAMALVSPTLGPPARVCAFARGTRGSEWCYAEIGASFVLERVPDRVAALTAQCRRYAARYAYACIDFAHHRAPPGPGT